MARLTTEECTPKNLSPLSLAFVGDGVYDLFVRETLVCAANRPLKDLNRLKVEQVRCQAQAKLMQTIESILTEEEAAVYRRGRNAHTGHTPKNATNADYHAATGFEALLGYLYLCGRIERIRELVSFHSQSEI
ncbi:MAG: Mini-ribonuclease 3 [Acutalibacteraceae bacterium]